MNSSTRSDEVNLTFLGHPVGPNLPLSLMLTVTVILATCFRFYWKVIRKDPRIVKYLNQFPGPHLAPVFGNGLQLFNIPHHKLFTFLDGLLKEHGKVMRIWLVNQPYILINSADEAEKILSSNVHINKGTDYEMLHPWFGTGLLTANGKKWYARRKMLTPAFHFKILEDFNDIFNEQAVIMKGLMEEQVGKILDICPYISKCTLDIICETAMGRSVHAQTQTDSEYVRAVHGMGDVMVQRAFTPWLRNPILWRFSSFGQRERKYLKVLHGFTNKVIQERKIERQMTKEHPNPNEYLLKDADDNLNIKKRRLAFLDLLLDVAHDGRILKDQDIREEVDTFMFEGHDTTAASLSWTIYLLAAHPEIQRRVQEEQDVIFGSDTNRPVTSSDMSQMKFLEQCIKESLRLFPSVPMFGRILTEDCTMSDTTLVPAGTIIYIITLGLHRDPDVFLDPHSFKPERFTMENSQGRSPYAFVPFSAGPRNCIGQKFALQEEKVILSHLFRKFDVTTTLALKDVEIVPDMIVRAKDGLPIKFMPRSKLFTE